jgi:hypothetical protein
MQADGGAIDTPFVEFDNAAGLGNDEFESVGADRPEVAGFCVEWEACCRVSRALPVREERFADVLEPHLFSIVEIVDGGVVAAAATSPVPDEKGEVSNVGVERWRAGRG